MNSTAALVSCVIPVHNTERYLGDAIDSALAQTYRPVEIIVIDDGSVDDTPKVIAGYGDRVIAARQENAGAPSARNHGLRLAQGEFVAFLDADDLWHKEKLAIQTEFLEQHPDVGYCLAHMQNFWVDELADEARRYRDHKLAKPMAGTIATLLARRELFASVGPLNAELRNRDMHDWMMRADRMGIPRQTLPQVLLSRRIHDANVSRQRPREELFDIIKQSLADRRREPSS